MIRMDSARQWWTGFTVFVALLLLPGCMNTQYTAAETEPTPAGFVEQTKQGLILQPAPLYGSHQLSIGAVQPAGKSPFLLLCAVKSRWQSSMQSMRMSSSLGASHSP